MQLNADQRIRMTLGDLIVQMEIAQDRISDLTGQVADLTTQLDAAKAAATPPAPSVPIAPAEPA